MNDEIIDIHVHFGAPKDEDSGCYWSPAFEKGIARPMQIGFQQVFTSQERQVPQ